MKRTLLVPLVALLPAVLGVMPGAAAPRSQYKFKAVADQGFDAFSFGCPSIGDAGDVVFHGNREGLEAIFRARHGKPQPIVDAETTGLEFLGFGESVDRRGGFSFAAARDDFSSEAILLAAPGRKTALTTIAETAPGSFASLGPDTSLNDAGQVAFAGALDDGDEGLFVGSGSGVSTIFLASTSEFAGSPPGPSLNDAGEIAFRAQRDDGSGGIFLFTGGGFVPINLDGGPVLFTNDAVVNGAGVVAFTGFTATESGVFTGTGGPITTVADTSGPYAFIGAPGPAINDAGTVAFNALLDEGGFGIFTGPDPVADRVIADGEPLDGAVAISPQLCREGINDDGEITFLALLDDGRAGVFVARPRGRR